MYDLIIDYQMAVCLGPAKLLQLLQAMYPERELYSISTGFMESPRYVAKACGVKGDALIGWLNAQEGSKHVPSALR